MIKKALILAMVALACPPGARAEIYLHLEGAPGEVTAQGYENWIAVSSMQFGVARSISSPVGGGGGRESSQPSLSEITLQKEHDGSSVELFASAVAGKITAGPAELHFTSAGPKGEPFAYYKITLTEPLLSSFQFSAGADSRPAESFAINYTKIDARTIRLDATGKPLEQTYVTYDLAKGTVSSGGTVDGVINAAPTIQSLADASTPEDTPLIRAFTINDSDSAVTSLVLAKTSSNSVLLPASRISFGGSGTSRTVILSPAPNQYGSTTVTLSVSDGNKAAATSFVLTVTPENDAPVISAPASISLVSGRPTPIAGIQVNDIDAGTSPVTLTATVTQGTLRTNAVIADLTVQDNGFSSVAVQGPVTAQNALLNHPDGLVYQNYPGFSGNDLLTLLLTDNGASGNGGAADHQVQVNLRVFASAYEQWQNTYFENTLENPEMESTLWGDAADSDLDEIPNLLEYVLRLNPILADAGDGPQLIPQTIGDDTFYTIVFNRHPDPAVEVFVEASSTLAPVVWSSAGTEIAQVSSTPTNGMEQLIFRDQRPLITTPNRFYRVGARLQP